MQNSVFLSGLQIHESWNAFLTDEMLAFIQEIESKIQLENATPGQERVLRFLEMDVEQIRVVILGQDPYPQEGVATGRAFEVSGLNSWHDKFRNVSLKNILRSIYKAYTGEILKYSEILKKINEGDRLAMSGDFRVLPPNRLFRYWWENENVLLLNTAFTCEIGKPNSHTKIWAPFTQKLLQFIAENNPKASWFLWGNNAQQVVAGLDIQNKFETSHPMICFDRENDILFGKVNPFEQTKDMVNWLGTDY